MKDKKAIEEQEFEVQRKLERIEERKLDVDFMKEKMKRLFGVEAVAAEEKLMNETRRNVRKYRAF